MKNIYIVDDIKENLQVLGNILTDNGYNISFARNGRQALEGLRTKLPDLILLDISMPEMDGYEVCKRIKSDERTKDIPVIFLTAKIQPEEIIKGFKLGGVDYITKPYNTEELLARVSTHLELKEAKEKLSESNATKDKFFSIIAHDLKNPLAAFRDATGMLVREEESFTEQDKKELMTELHQSADHVYKLLENLLDWSRSQTDSISFNPEICDVSELVQNNVYLLQGQAGKKNIKLVAETTPGLFARIDVNLILTVIRNLTSNALKFTPESGEVVVGASQSGNYVNIYVKDNGIGISEEDQKKLFRIDIKHSTAGTSNESGTGLGLILCQEFVARHNSRIDVESRLGEGTTFSLNLPLEDNI